MISVEVIGFHQIREHDFVAIAPVWAHEHSKGYGEYPCNHFRLQGKIAKYTEPIENRLWNPDNVFSDESWLEVRLYLIRWSYSPQVGIWGGSDRRSLNLINGSTTLGCRFFLPKLQLRQFYEVVPRSTVAESEASTYNISHATCLN